VQHVGAGDGVAVSTAAIGEATTTSSSSLCPGPPPPPIECFRVVCLTNDASWDYRPLAAGTACSDGGTCDGAGNCVVPVPEQRTLAVPGSAISFGLALLLDGSVVSVDTTQNAPPLITGTHQACTIFGGHLICWTVTDAHWTYIQFSSALKNRFPGLRDYWSDLSTICNWYTCVDVNQIHGELGQTQVTFGQYSSGAYVRATLPFTSAHPTLIVDSAPDVEFSNMQLSLQGTIFPNDAQTGLAIVSDVEATVTLDTNVPDWLIDIEGKINTAVHDRVRDAFRDQGRRDALDGALTQAIDQFAAATVPGWTGFNRITLVSASGGTLYITYVPN
jgi:hypothetical protein